MYTFLSQSLNPVPWAVVILGAIIAWLWRTRRGSSRWLTVLTVTYFFLLIPLQPWISYLALASLEWGYSPLAHRPDAAEAIVVLSGYVEPPDMLNPRGILGVDTFQRCMRGVELFREGNPCLVVVSGGKVDPTQEGPTLAEAMRDFLVQIGVPSSHILMEDKSRTTFENASETAGLLAGRKIKRVVLVTDASHMYRAERCFQRQGIEVIPAACRYRTLTFEVGWSCLWPNVFAAEGVAEACHEWIGLLWYRLHGRI